MTEFEDIFSCCKFLAAADLIIDADRLYAEADLVRLWNEPWARNRTRKADKIMEYARRLAGDRGLPWGVK